MKSKRYSVIVVDDEEDIRKTLIAKLTGGNSWDVQGEAETVPEAIELIKNVNPNAIFLDIKLREGDAFTVLSNLRGFLKKQPYIILNTGYAEFEIAQKVVNEFSDYEIMLIKKPFWEYWDEKEMEILHKLEAYLEDDEDKISLSNNQLIIRVGNITHFINPDSIQFIEVESTNSSKVKICTPNDVIIINKSLSSVKKILPDHFVQINRQSVVNRKYIKVFDHEDHILRLEDIDDRVFDVGMVYRKNLFN